MGNVNLITVTGAGVETPNDLWNRVLDQLELPQSESDSSTDSISETGKSGINAKVKVLAFEVGGMGLTPQRTRSPAQELKAILVAASNKL